MADDVKNSIDIQIKEGILICSIPLTSEDNDETKSKIMSYGALKVVEEQISIFYMQRAMRKQQILRTNGPIIPGRTH